MVRILSLSISLKALGLLIDWSYQRKCQWRLPLLRFSNRLSSWLIWLHQELLLLCHEFAHKRLELCLLCSKLLSLLWGYGRCAHLMTRNSFLLPALPKVWLPALKLQLDVIVIAILFLQNCLFLKLQLDLKLTLYLIACLYKLLTF